MKCDSLQRLIVHGAVETETGLVGKTLIVSSHHVLSGANTIELSRIDGIHAALYEFPKTERDSIRFSLLSYDGQKYDGRSCQFSVVRYNEYWRADCLDCQNGYDGLVNALKTIANTTHEVALDNDFLAQYFHNELNYHMHMAKIDVAHIQVGFDLYILDVTSGLSL